MSNIDHTDSVGSPFASPIGDPVDIAHLSERDHPSPGWHADRHDAMTTRYWDGTAWTAARRWNGTEWVAVPAAPAAATSSPMSPGTVATNAISTFSESSRTFKTFVAAAVATAVGCFVPVTTISTASGYSETRTLTDAGGISVLILGLAAAIVWLARSSRHGVIGRGSLWGIGAMSGMIAAFTLAVCAATGTTTSEDDLVFTTVTRSQTVAPGLGLLLLLAASAMQVIAIVMAVRDRSRTL